MYTFHFNDFETFSHLHSRGVPIHAMKTQASRTCDTVALIECELLPKNTLHLSNSVHNT